MDDSVTDDEVAIPGFTVFRNDRMSVRHGGVALYVHNHFYPELLPHLLNLNVESVFVKIQVGNNPCLVGSLYRPPQTNVATHEIIVKHIEKAINLNYKTIIMGDFNLDINDTKQYSKQYLLFNSCHPKHVATNITYNLARRICTIVDNTETRNIRLEELKTFLKNQNYPKTLIEAGIKKAKEENQETL